MTDPRAENVLRFRDDHGAQLVVILTAVTPFNVSQNRLLVVQADYHAQLITCSGCTPRTALGQGLMRDISPKVMLEFSQALQAAQDAWDRDAMPPNVHDGITYTIEQVDANGYQRVRMVDPEAGSPHARLLEALAAHFPEARRIVS